MKKLHLDLYARTFLFSRKRLTERTWVALALSLAFASACTPSSPPSPAAPAPQSVNGSGTNGSNATGPAPQSVTPPPNGANPAVPTLPSQSSQPSSQSAANPSSTPSITYGNTIASMMSNNCSCHSAGGRSPELDTYGTIAADAQGALQAMNSNMPPGQAMSAGAIQQFQTWISEGLPQ